MLNFIKLLTELRCDSYMQFLRVGRHIVKTHKQCPLEIIIAQASQLLICNTLPIYI